MPVHLGKVKSAGEGHLANGLCIYLSSPEADSQAQRLFGLVPRLHPPECLAGSSVSNRIKGGAVALLRRFDIP